MLGACKKHPQAYLLYVEDCFLWSDNADDRVFAKGREYMLVNTLERDARNDGWKAGVAHGLAEGEIRGSRQAKVETAKNLLQFGLSIENIAQATGLSKAEVEAL